MMEVVVRGHMILLCLHKHEVVNKLDCSGGCTDSASNLHPILGTEVMGL